MASNRRILHVERGFYFSKSCAEMVMREHCTITWDTPGRTVRDTTDAERAVLMARRNEQIRLQGLREGILEPYELPNLHFDRPTATAYVAPREGYEEMHAPLAVRICRWPRKFDRNLTGATA